VKIVYVTPRFYPHIGGVETHVYEIAKRVAKEFDVEVLATDPTGKLPKIEKVEHFIVRRFKSFAPGEAYYFSPELYRYLKRKSLEYDIIHAHNYHALTSLISFLGTKGKYILTPHTFGQPQKIFRRFAHCIYKPLGREMLQEAERVIAVSRMEKNMLKTFFSVGEDRLVYIPLFVEIPDKPNNDVFRRDEIKLLFVGRLSYEKNVDILLSAFNMIEEGVENSKKLKLIIVGDGPQKKYLEDMSKFSKNIEFTGTKSKNELKLLYKTCDMLILPSRFEVFPLVVLEAMSYGLPVIVTPVGDLKYLQNWRQCVFTEVNNIADLAEKIRFFLENPRESRKIGSKGRKYVEKYHDVNKIFKKYETLYKEVMQ